MKTDISILLDRSGSMETIKADTIGGFNTFLLAQQAIPGAAALTLVQFDGGGYDVVVNAKPLAEVPPLTPQTFVPRGSTPLHDAMGRLIVETGERFKAIPDSARPEKVIFVVITDGEENASREYTGPQIAAMVTHQREVYKWEFVYLGANHDAVTAASQMGISRAHAANYSADPHGTRAAYGVTSNLVGAMRSGKAGIISDDDRKDMQSRP